MKTHHPADDCEILVSIDSTQEARRCHAVAQLSTFQTGLYQMKPRTLVRAVASVLFALLFSVLPAGYGDVNVTNTTVASASNPINICADSVTLSTVINGMPGGGSFKQTLPTHCTVTITNGSFPAGFTAIPNNNEITYTVPAGMAAFTVTADLIIPCKVTPDANNALPILYSQITNTLHANPFTFQVRIPRMNIINFLDDHNVAIGPNTPQELLVSSQSRHRKFDFLVSYGTIHEFTFTYHRESEIQGAAFQVFGVRNGIPTNHGLGGLTGVLNSDGSVTYSFTPGMMSWLFLGDVSGLGGGLPNQPYDMVFNDSIQITENFKVTQCSETLPDATEFTLNWGCPSQNSACSSVTEQRAISVKTSTRGITPRYTITPDLDICGVNGSHIRLNFDNPTHDTDRIAGSAEKTLHRIEFSMNLSDFSSWDGPFLEGSGTANSVNVATLGTFYTYDPVNHRVVLDFDQFVNVLPLGASGPLEIGFFPETPNPIFNEFKEGTTITLRFGNAKFRCAGDPSDPNSPFYGENGAKFGDCPSDGGKLALNHMFFGRNGNDRVVFDYDNMCQQDHLAPTHDEVEYANYANRAGVITIAEAGCTDCTPLGSEDLNPGQSADLDFYYISGSDTPFSLIASVTPTIYFNCPTLTYQALLTIPHSLTNDPAVTSYQLNGVDYYPDPNDTTNFYPLDVSQSLQMGDTLVYTLSVPVDGTKPHVGGSGRLKANVTLINCPMNTGGSDIFTVSIQAICNGCTACAYTTACLDTTLFHHCLGRCGEGSPPYNTLNLSFNRDTFGWTDSTMQTRITSGTGLNLKRFYNSDRVNFTSGGEIVPNGTNTPLSYRIGYASAANFQFYQFESGQLDYEYTDNECAAFGLGDD